MSAWIGLDAGARLNRHAAARLLSLWHSAGFARNLGVVAGGTIVGQVALILVSPILTRIYAPEHLGVYGAYTTLLGLGLVLCSLRLESAIPLLTDHRQAFHLAYICMALVLVMSVIAATVCVRFGQPLATLLALPLFNEWGPILSLGIFAGGLYQTASLLCIRFQQYDLLSKSRAVNGMVIGASQVVLGITNPAASSLLAGDAFGRLAALAPIHKLAPRLRGSLGDLNATAVICLFRRFQRIPLLLLPAALLNLLSSNALLLWGPKFFTLAETGAYFLAYRILAMPAALLSGSANQVFFGRVANEDSEVSRAHLTRTVALFLFAISLPVYAGVALHGPFLFEKAFGAAWRSAGTYAILISPSILLWTVSSSISPVLLIEKRYVESFLINVAQFTIVVTSLYFGVRQQSFYRTVMFLSLANIVMQSASIYRFCRVVHLNVRTLAAQTIRPVLFPNLLFFGIQMMIWAFSEIGAFLIFFIGCPATIAWTSQRVRYLLRSVAPN